jgi:ACS family hexuronate transporter-like MFS transporter
VNPATDAARSRWLVLAVFVLSTAINYLDRQTLATLAPIILTEFHLSNTQYGWLLSAFSVSYAASAPFAGILIDAIGLTRGASFAVALWSLTGIATGFTRSLGTLAACRVVLGAAEAAGIPAAGKAIHTYLRPPERALGNAFNSAAVSIGLIVAPPLATWLALRTDWRTAFIVTGALGLAWIPLWHWASRLAPSAPAPKAEAAPANMLRDTRLWAFIPANALGMLGFSLWTNWTMLYLVNARQLSMNQAKWYAAIPPMFWLTGGFAGGWLSLRFMRTTVRPAPAARFRVCLAAAVLSLATAAIPFAPGAAWATAGISLSLFSAAAFSVNMYTLPLDVFGGPRAAFAVSILVASYGAVQLLISPIFGYVIDHYGYAPLTTVAALTPFAACAVLWISRSVR